MSEEAWEEIAVPTHPLEDGKWVATVVEIRDNSTGIVREYQSSAILVDGDTEPDSYLWEEGNYACDCNRSLFFARAAGEDEDWERDCGDSAYSVRVRNKKSGRVFYSEFDA